MVRLPVIVGFGGFSAAGRSSSHHAYRRTVIDSLDASSRNQTLLGLAAMMKLVRFDQASGLWLDLAAGVDQLLSEQAVLDKYTQAALDGSLIRRIEPQYFDVDAVEWHKSVALSPESSHATFLSRERDLPEPLPACWQVSPVDGEPGRVKVTITDILEAKVDSLREMPVKAAGQLPSGYDPADHYNARFHPRALQMAIVGASDAVHSLGIAWEKVVAAVRPDEIGVYASNAMSQLDENGFGGMLQQRLKGGRVSAKQCPLGLNTMPADFINAYVLGSVGHTGAIVGACATFLYNLQAAINDITAGRRRVAVVGNAEAPLLPEVMDGYGAMGALASDENLRKLDGLSPEQEPNHRRASRPFGDNAGFTIAESTQYVILMDDALALELGADIHGAATDVFINADGFKKSISAPGPGNYITMAKAVASAIDLLGAERVQKHSFIQAHGSSTPANRVTESEIFDRLAGVFGIEQWPVTAVKAYVGHSLAPASADQLVSTLGVFKYGFIPGVKTIDRVADDVHQQHLLIPTHDLDQRSHAMDIAFLNSKGFGGNNATATILSPNLVNDMLAKRHGQQAFAAYELKRAETRLAANAYDERATKAQFDTIYKFGEGMIDEAELGISTTSLSVPGFAQAVNLVVPSGFKDMV
ncbi:beta-ketoacyl synthase [Simiduia curdlanivorans]|uniref:Beta-ketoacyl synthase n=1 Tax=Simiduia curdlanivorans TaxID=1492769 RepID=A0ABV8VAX9_9GAMM|nr:beta-ketoacyl synthase [Simiduia curdlanivorans]MDN3639440.1 beta-ketoacyl synthase [Simiduia curdlanivorans]